MGNAPVPAAAGLVLHQGVAQKASSHPRVMSMAQARGSQRRLLGEEIPVTAQAALHTAAFQLNTGRFSLKIF